MEEEVASYLGGGGDLGEDLGENWAGICYVKATDIHPDIFTLYRYPPRYPTLYCISISYPLKYPPYVYT